MYLRVVRSRRGDWDALDQLEDEAKPTEAIIVYRRRDDREITKYHLKFSGKAKRESGFIGARTTAYLAINRVTTRSAPPRLGKSGCLN
jgi:hypothetical protein